MTSRTRLPPLSLACVEKIGAPGDEAIPSITILYVHVSSMYTGMYSGIPLHKDTPEMRTPFEHASKNYLNAILSTP